MFNYDYITQKIPIIQNVLIMGCACTNKNNSEVNEILNKSLYREVVWITSRREPTEFSEHGKSKSKIDSLIRDDQNRIMLSKSMI